MVQSGVFLSRSQCTMWCHLSFLLIKSIYSRSRIMQAISYKQFSVWIKLTGPHKVYTYDLCIFTSVISQQLVPIRNKLVSDFRFMASIWYGYGCNYDYILSCFKFYIMHFTHTRINAIHFVMTIKSLNIKILTCHLSYVKCAGRPGVRVDW